LLSSRNIAPKVCPVCGEPFLPGSRSWYRECGSCRFLAADLPVLINGQLDRHVDEGEREKGLFSLRQANFVRILNRMEACLGDQKGSLLEVGCAHGWFLQAAKKRGYAVTGLEPDPQFYKRADSNGLNINKGYFPGDLPPDNTFDVIIFNDVFEHLPNPDEAMSRIAERLNPSGALVINIPNSEGFFYRAALMLDALGIQGPLRRMWQVNYPSPLLSYFNPDSLARLAEKCGLAEVDRSTLPSVTVDGLWHRLRHVRRLQPANMVICAGVWLAVATLSPLISRLPSDISLLIFRKPDCTFNSQE
jgi:2-polyprenyl-3-methyl-5-hydroxy-6-metoxy-1,4-benzoquinol methylase